MNIPPDIKFLAALGLLGVVMFTLPQPAGTWFGVLLVLAAITYAEKQKNGHSFIGDTLKVFGLENKK